MNASRGYYLRPHRVNFKTESRKMEMKIIEHGSREYGEMLQLRIETLLRPIDVPSSFIVPENETKDLLIGVFEESQMIACCVLTEKDNATVQLRQMAVHGSRQGSGIGAQLLAFAEQVAGKKGYRLMMMHARAAVCPFYEKCGYRVAGPQFYEVGIPHFVMQKGI